MKKIFTLTLIALAILGCSKDDEQTTNQNEINKSIPPVPPGFNPLEECVNNCIFLYQQDPKTDLCDCVKFCQESTPKN